MSHPYFRGVVWPRPKTQVMGYRYVVVGMLVTDESLRGMDKNEIVLSGNAFMLGDALETIKHGRATRILGDANDVLLGLTEGIEEIV